MGPVGRLAPSPTGRLHLGHARTFLLAWWHTRARGGRVLLRIEDLDQERVKPGMVEECLATLTWLGLDWDGPVLVQSREPAPARAALAELVARDQVYGCDCSRRDIERASSAPHAEDGELRYPGTCRARGLLAVPERVHPAEVLPHFDLARLPRAPVRLAGPDRPAFLGPA